MARSYNRLRETTFDLFVERDTLPAYFRLITLLSTWLIYVGYILFALSFSTSDEQLNVPRNLVIALASAFLIVGYIGGALVGFFSRSLLFLIDSALYPILTSSLMGIFITALTYGVSRTHPVPRVYMAVPLITSCVTTAVVAVALGLVYMEVNKIKSRDERRRWHVTQSPYTGELQPVQSQPRSSSASRPDDDPQRRQLLRLLQERHEQPSMENMRGTYKIDLPGESRPHYVHWAPEQEPARQRFTLSGLLPWNNTNSGTFKDARELRRDAIERSGLPPGVVDPANAVHHQRSSSNGPGLNAAAQPDIRPPETQSQPAWGWPPATRYA